MSTNDAAPQSALQDLLRTLDLEPIEDNLFLGPRGIEGWQRVFGGQVLGQSLVAAARTVEPGRLMHSLHGYFLLAGDPARPILYDVERIRDGGSFTTRRVKAIQHGRPIFSMSSSFHKDEPGFEHQAQMPDLPPPEALPNPKDVIDQHIDALPPAMRSYWSRERPIEMRAPDLSRYFTREKKPPAQSIWIRANGTLPDDPVIHQAVLAYASDFTLLDTALIAHGKLLFDADVQLASLDHGIWYHRPFRADEWMLYVQDSPSAFGARGFCRGSIYTRDGQLIASVVQEGLMRQRTSAFVPN
ncbi:acyl-CoA thioesterase II [Hyphomicrobium sp. NDB2Meth4]|uniref:acyl-CoA thioesterase II n=1 Tax=Hyphomicrobium sp. NDB2Meth4 TaxID=1892846 RepID=UPI0009301EF0|nr:acyl-CoA thioesterase II [Hyphomicrobium sp. NDB2Meth4]